MTVRAKTWWFTCTASFTTATIWLVVTGAQAASQGRPGEALGLWFVAAWFAISALACAQIGAGK